MLFYVGSPSHSCCCQTQANCMPNPVPIQIHPPLNITISFNTKLIFQTIKIFHYPQFIKASCFVKRIFCCICPCFTSLQNWFKNCKNHFYIHSKANTLTVPNIIFKLFPSCQYSCCLSFLMRSSVKSGRPVYFIACLGLLAL